jgi:TolB protein
MVRITQNEGVNEEPAWAPNGRAIAFASQRKGGMGIYIANSDGTGDAVRVWKGKGTSVDWGPPPRQ